MAEEVTRYSVDADAADASRAQAASGEEDQKPKAPAEDGKPVEEAAKADDTAGADDAAKLEGKADEDAGDAKKTTDDDDAFDLHSLYGEWEEKGALSEESQTKAMNTIFHPDLPEEMKKRLLLEHVEGLGTRKGMNVLNAYAEVGGEKQFKGMMTWAATALSPEDIEAYDTAVSNPKARDMAIKGLYARYEAAVGAGTVDRAEPDLAHNSGASEGTPPIGSRQELAAIQSTARYKSDPAYREEIARQIGVALKSGRYTTV